MQYAPQAVYVGLYLRRNDFRIDVTHIIWNINFCSECVYLNMFTCIKSNSFLTENLRCIILYKS